jgi:hypothetical protein
MQPSLPLCHKTYTNGLYLMKPEFGEKVKVK